MKLIYTDKTKIPTYEDIQKGYRIKHPEKISGFQGLFVVLDDIYAIGRLEENLDRNPSIGDELLKMIDRFRKEDYGFVTADELDQNTENKYLGGSCTWNIARYGFGAYGGVVLEFIKDKGYMYFINDPVIDEIYAAYGEKNTREIRYFKEDE